MAAKKKVIAEEKSIDEVTDAGVQTEIDEAIEEGMNPEAQPEIVEPDEKVDDIESAIEEDILDIKKKAYEKTVSLNKVDFDRMVDSAQTSFPFQTDDDIIAQLVFFKDKIATYPNLIDAFIAELRKRGLSDKADEFQEYYDSIDYTRPWMRM